MERKAKLQDEKAQREGEEEEEEEEEEEGETSVAVDKKQQVCNRFLNGKKCRLHSRGKCRYSHDESARKEALIARRKRLEKQQYMRATDRPNGNDSLLRKLLCPDIRKERSVILKCIRHVLLMKSSSV